ncbi:hypothetical protein DFH09DRAFT_1099562 [Mycena vulgaris]|nr:hypothetical protein DFH09DRAFT_1099562 [Mycena vulgaris]
MTFKFGRECLFNIDQMSHTSDSAYRLVRYSVFRVRAPDFVAKIGRAPPSLPGSTMTGSGYTWKYHLGRNLAPEDWVSFTRHAAYVKEFLFFQWLVISAATWLELGKRPGPLLANLAVFTSPGLPTTVSCNLTTLLLDNGSTGTQASSSYASRDERSPSLVANPGLTSSIPETRQIICELVAHKWARRLRHFVYNPMNLTRPALCKPACATFPLTALLEIAMHWTALRYLSAASSSGIDLESLPRIATMFPQLLSLEVNLGPLILLPPLFATPSLAHGLRRLFLHSFPPECTDVRASMQRIFYALIHDCGPTESFYLCMPRQVASICTSVSDTFIQNVSAGYLLTQTNAKLNPEFSGADSCKIPETRVRRAGGDVRTSPTEDPTGARKARIYQPIESILSSTKDLAEFRVLYGCFFTYIFGVLSVDIHPFSKLAIIR